MSRPRGLRRKPKQCLILHPKILNFQGIPLSKNQIKLLSKRLKFTPTPKINTSDIKLDMEDFMRKIMLREFLADRNDCNENPQDPSDSLVRHKGILNHSSYKQK